MTAPSRMEQFSKNTLPSGPFRICIRAKIARRIPPDRLSSGRGRASLDVVKSPRMSYILGHSYQKIV